MVHARFVEEELAKGVVMSKIVIEMSLTPDISSDLLLAIENRDRDRGDNIHLSHCVRLGSGHGISLESRGGYLRRGSNDRFSVKNFTLVDAREIVYYF